MIPYILTYADAIQHLIDYVRHHRSATQDDIRQAIHASYREVASAHNWAYLYRHGRVNVQASQTDGTIQYDHTGGTYERQLTLTGATWPSDVIYWRIRIGDVEVCEIAERKSDSVVTLDPQLNPGEDVAAGTSYTLFRSVYPLPNDFVNMAGAWGDSAWRLGSYVPPEDWMTLERYTTESGDIKYHTIMSLPDAIGTMGLFVWPHPSSAESVDFIYQRRPRPLRYSGFDTVDSGGTVSTTAGSASVTGSGTAFESGMVGSIIRISRNTTKPSGTDGVNPFLEERSITAVADSATLTLDANAANTSSGVAYRVTDPIDIDHTMFDAFLACCRKNMASRLGIEDQRYAFAQYRQSLHEARGAQHRTYDRKVMGKRPAPWIRFADRSTIGADVE